MATVPEHLPASFYARRSTRHVSSYGTRLARLVATVGAMDAVSRRESLAGAAGTTAALTITVGTAPGKADVWDSGKVASAEQTAIA